MNGLLNKLLISLFFLSFFSCNNDISKIKSAIDTSLLNTEKADDVTIIYSKEGFTKAKLSTKTFRHIQDTQTPYIEMLNAVKIEFYNDSLQTQSTLTAKYGKYFESNGNVLMRDSVVVINIKNEQLNTEELVWNEKMQKFFTEKFVKISTPTQIFYGDGLESNQNFSEYKIINIKGIIGVNKNTIPK